MRKVLFIIVLLLSVISGLVFWIINTDLKFDLSQILELGVISILVLFSITVAISRIGSIKQGLPAEDEFSKKILNKAAARSYYFSLYLWLGLMYLSTKGVIDQENLFGTGIIAMALLFAIHWVILKYKGVTDE